MDCISVKNLKIFASHGVNDFEKRDGQYFVLDIDSFLDLSLPCQSDNVDDTVSYAKIIKTATAVFTSQMDDLIERAAQRVADELLNSFPKIKRVTVEVKKPDAPIKADFGYVSVKIERSGNE